MGSGNKARVTIFRFRFSRPRSANGRASLTALLRGEPHSSFASPFYISGKLNKIAVSGYSLMNTLYYGDNLKILRDPSRPADFELAWRAASTPLRRPGCEPVERSDVRIVELV